MNCEPENSWWRKTFDCKRGGLFVYSPKKMVKSFTCPVAVGNKRCWAFFELTFLYICSFSLPRPSKVVLRNNLKTNRSLIDMGCSNGCECRGWLVLELRWSHYWLSQIFPWTFAINSQKVAINLLHACVVFLRLEKKQSDSTALAERYMTRFID